MVENTENVAEEIQQEESVQPQQDNHSPVETQDQKELSDKEINFQRMRESKEQLEREVRELREAMVQKPQSNEDKVIDNDDLDDDDLVEGKVVNKLRNQVKELQKAMTESQLSSEVDRLKSTFKDFDQVVSPENIDKLKKTEPELYASITSGSNFYAKGVSAYKTIKALGIGDVKDYDAQKEQVQNNHGRPVSAQAIRGQGALSEANIFAKGLTPELKKQLQQEMSHAVKAR